MQDIVSAVIEWGSYPFPSRTRKSSPRSPMVPGPRIRESRSPLDSRGPLPRRQGASSFSCPMKTAALPFRRHPRGGGDLYRKKRPSPASFIFHCSLLLDPSIPSGFRDDVPLRGQHRVPRRTSCVPLAFRIAHGLRIV